MSGSKKALASESRVEAAKRYLREAQRQQRAMKEGMGEYSAGMGAPPVPGVDADPMAKLSPSAQKAALAANMEPGVEVLKQYIDVLKKALAQFKPMYDEDKYHRQALSNQQVTLPGEAPKMTTASGDYGADYNARQGMGDQQRAGIDARNAGDLNRQRQFRTDWDAGPASQGYRQRAVRRPMGRPMPSAQPSMAPTGTAG